MRTGTAAAFITLSMASGAIAQDELDWVVIGDPGNRAVNAEEAPGFQPDNWEAEGPVGRVDHVFRIMRTEVTAEQWYEFVLAYAPYWDGNPWDSYFTSPWVSYDFLTGEYELKAWAAKFPTETTWRLAARYCNWLHNGKAPDEEAFEAGVYDASTFITNKDGTFEDQTDPSPGARFWIPTVHEWTKAMHYDPDRYGPGEEGYWKYPNGRDEWSYPDWPLLGGETNAGSFAFGQAMDVGSYPWEASPYGLLDGSGSMREWTTTRLGTEHIFARRSETGLDGNNDHWDQIDTFWSSRPFLAGIGFRLASASVCSADCNWDGRLNVLDFVCFQGLFVEQDHTADLNGDGVLDMIDFVEFKQAFLEGCR